MLKIKNRLITPIICLLFGIFINCNALAEDGIISSVSRNMVISLQNSENTYELSDIYIPNLILPTTSAKAAEIFTNAECNFPNISDKPGRHASFYAVITKKGDKKSLQELLLENGLALAYFIDEPSNAPLLFAAEARGRKAKLGIWKDSSFKVHDSNEITDGYKRNLGKFIIVSGVVNNTYNSKKNTYINFGEDWKTDFSVQFENKTIRNFTGFSPEKLKGKRISVRGWLEDYNGPFMKIFNPANVEIIAEK